MTIALLRDKCKAIVARIPRDILLVGTLVSASLLSFWFGYQAGQDTGQGTEIAAQVFPSDESGAKGQIVASKSGTKYYDPSCPGAARISEANKVWFATPAAAEAAGYSAAANCPPR